jgi:hypothetical protein
LIHSEDGFVEDGSDDFKIVCVGTCGESVGPSMLLVVDRQLVEAFGFRWCT